MHPLLVLYLKITAAVAIAIVALVLLAVLAKILIVAGIVAAVVVGGAFLYSVCRRRQHLPVR